MTKEKTAKNKTEMKWENIKMKKVYVVGHKNPDTDSICSAIAYAHLKHQITGEITEQSERGKSMKKHSMC